MGNNPSTTSKPLTSQNHGSVSDHPTKTQRRDRRVSQSQQYAVAHHHSRPISIAGASTSVATALAAPVVSASLPPSVASSGHKRAAIALMEEVTQPVDVPLPTGPIVAAAMATSVQPRSPPQFPPAPIAMILPSLVDDPSSALRVSGSITDLGHLNRPPRLPLPIEPETRTPVPQVVAPPDGDSVVVLADQHVTVNQYDAVAFSDPAAALAAPDADHSQDPVDAARPRPAELSRKLSGLSVTAGDDDLMKEWAVPNSPARPTVPVRIEWLNGGDRVYVTGTIFQWTKKFRLAPLEGRPGAFASTIRTVPGTHHIRFLVDNVMQTSPDIPTTVDLANNLVNYIEVTAPPSEATHGADLAVPDSRDSQAGSSGAAVVGVHDEAAKQSEPLPKTRPALPADQYLHRIPQYLLDFDQPEDSSAYQYAVRAINQLTNPPSLPGFLAKPILNAPVVIKDDHSVLHMPPNHTVLNHLATSSIKNNMLAVSVTTRYRSKYVTTIIYKPTGE